MGTNGINQRLVSFFTRPILPARAISLRSRRLAAAAVSLKKDRLVLNRAAVEPLPEGIIEPRFEDQNIKNRDRLVAALRQLLERAGLAGQRQWSLAIPRKATRTFIIQLDEPPKRKKELLAILEWKAERLLEVPMSELTVAFERLQPAGPAQDGAGRAERYLAVAGLNQVLESYQSVLEELGLTVGYVTPSHLAETAWLALSGVRNDALLLTADQTEITIICIRGKDILSIRSVEYAPDTLPDELHRSLVYYLDRLAPSGEDGPDPQLDHILLIGEGLDPQQMKHLCQSLFPSDKLPHVRALRQDKVEGLDSLNLELLATAAGLAAMGL
jgi:Tfp pilus assembly PilM family ATPase